MWSNHAFGSVLAVLVDPALTLLCCLSLIDMNVANHPVSKCQVPLVSSSALCLASSSYLSASSASSLSFWAFLFASSFNLYASTFSANSRFSYSAAAANLTILS
jgi:hypothetical protein